MNKMLIGGLMLACTQVASAVSLGDSAEIHGFINQGFINTSANPYLGDTLSGSSDYREIGLNGFWEISDKVRIAGQVLSREAGDAYDGEVGVDFLLLDYHAYADESLDFGVRVGRFKTQYGIYNATRDVSNSHPGIFVPASIYFESFRDVMLSADGVNLYGGYNNDWGSFNLDVYSGKRSLDTSTFEQFMFNRDINGSFDSVSLKGLKLSYRPLGLHDLNLAFSVINPEFELKDSQGYQGMSLYQAATDLAMNPQHFINYLTDIEIDSLLTLYSAQYGLNDWLFTAEYMRIDSTLSELTVLHQPQPSEDFTSEGGYLQAEWFVTQSFSSFWRYEEFYFDVNDRDGLVRQGRGISANAHSNYAKGHTLGFRWHFGDSFALSAQYSRNKGSAWLPAYDGLDSAALEEDWDMTAVQFSFYF